MQLINILILIISICSVLLSIVTILYKVLSKKPFLFRKKSKMLFSESIQKKEEIFSHMTMPFIDDSPMFSTDPITSLYTDEDGRAFTIYVYCSRNEISKNTTTNSNMNILIKEQISSIKIVFGRDKTCDFIINDRAVSRKHFEILLCNSKWYIKDLASHNGTIVNGIKIQQMFQIEEPINVSVGTTDITIKICNSHLQDEEW